MLALFLLGSGSPQFRAQIHPLTPSMQLCAQSTQMFSTQILVYLLSMILNLQSICLTLPYHHQSHDITVSYM